MSRPKLLDLFSAGLPHDREDDACWEWTGKRSPEGYGRIYSGGSMVYAHRLSYESSTAPIPDGLEIDHLCRNRACVNPAHLEPVTHAENQRRIALRQKRCRRNGHDWTDPANVYTRPDGRRWCAACSRDDQKRRYADA